MNNMTYLDLLQALNNLTDEQLNCMVTVELGITDECYGADLRICDSEHGVLDENHPVIYAEDA